MKDQPQPETLVITGEERNDCHHLPPHGCHYPRQSRVHPRDSDPLTFLQTLAYESEGLNLQVYLPDSLELRDGTAYKDKATLVYPI
jgi:hypothetical protein